MINVFSQCYQLYVFHSLFFENVVLNREIAKNNQFLNFHKITRPKIQFSKKYQLATLNKIDFGMLLTHRYFALKVKI